MQLVDDQWSAHSDLLLSLAELAQRAVTAARSTGGKAFDVLAPPWEPDHASPAMLLAERLTPLRFHRFDAHIAAWRAAGLTVEEAQSLPAGPLRDSIERDTNQRAAAPYATLSVEERFTFCAGLGALPG